MKVGIQTSDYNPTGIIVQNEEAIITMKEI